MFPGSQSKRSVVGLSLAGLVILGVWGLPLLRDLSPENKGKDAASVKVAELSKPAIDFAAIAAPHLRMATERSQEAIDEQIEPINQFFKSAKKGTQKFAELSLSWGSKWRLVADGLPYTRGDRHSEYLRARFEEHLFTPSQFEAVVRQSVDGYLSELRSIEGKMLVDLRADIEDFPTDSSLRTLGEVDWQEAFDDAIARATSATSQQLESDVGTQLVSIITGEVLTQVAVRLGVSSGILTAGAASGWATFGVGLVVGIIIDQLVTVAWDHWTDPAGKLTKQLNQKLDELNILIRNGDSQVQGLRSRFRKISDQRALLRKDAIMELLETHSAGAVK